MNKHYISARFQGRMAKKTGFFVGSNRYLHAICNQFGLCSGSTEHRCMDQALFRYRVKDETHAYGSA
jgi:hypothetical protein